MDLFVRPLCVKKSAKDSHIIIYFIEEFIEEIKSTNRRKSMYVQIFKAKSGHVKYVVVSNMPPDDDKELISDNMNLLYDIINYKSAEYNSDLVMYVFKYVKIADEWKWEYSLFDEDDKPIFNEHYRTLGSM